MLYKIRNKEGLFKKAGCYYDFGKKGKVWSDRKAFSLHLALFIDKNYSRELGWIVDDSRLHKCFEDCTVIEIDEVNGGITETPFEVWYTNYRVMTGK